MAARRLSLFLVLTSLVVALALNLGAIRNEWLFWKPPVLLLVALYWLLFEPQTFGMAFAFLLGLLLDFASGAPAGEFAMAFSVTAYLAQILEHRLKHFTIFYQCLLVGGLTLIYQLISVTIDVAIDGGSLALSHFYPALTAMLVWPLVAGILGRTHRYGQ